MIAPSSALAGREQYRKAFYKRTRRGKVVQIVQERYLRSDLDCGVMHGALLTASALRDVVAQAPHRQLLVVDTNIALHQIDLLEFSCPATALLVLTQTVLQELKHLNVSVFRRVLELAKDEKRSFIFFANEFAASTAAPREQQESANDANDRAIVLAAAHFQRVLDEGGTGTGGETGAWVGAVTGTGAGTGVTGAGRVVFLTNDAANRERARGLGLLSENMRQYVHRHRDYPELLDLVAEDGAGAGGGAGGAGMGEVYFPQHEPLSVLLEGLRQRRFLRGTLRCQREGAWDCYVVVHSADGQSRRSVQIMGLRRVNRALDGDVVALELCEAADPNDTDKDMGTSGSEGGGMVVGEETAEPSAEAMEGIASASASFSTSKSTPTSASASAPSDLHAGPLYGRVVGVIKRNWRQYAGSLDLTSATAIAPSGAAGGGGGDADAGGADEASRVQFVPVDKRAPRVWVSTRRLSQLAGCRLLVAIDAWPSHSLLPLGHYVRVLGKDGDKATETAVLLHEFDVPHMEFSPAVMACLPPPGWTITEDIVKQRTDLRHLPVVSIDPPGCKDIDDALHCLRLPSGLLQVGVHIADVTHFLHSGSAMDKEAAHRSTSTYLVERRLDMLPGLLTTQLCSLRSKEDHLAFSILWEMDDQANIYDVRFCKSAIHSVAALSYDEAQSMLDAPDSTEVNRSVNLLNTLARTLRRRRIEAGALTLASPEVRFQLDSETRNPTDVAVYAHKESNALVEEMMLLANITVSKQVLRTYPTLGVLRRHQPPSREQFAPLLGAALAVGVHLDISSSKTLADSLDAAVRKQDPYFNKLLRILSTRCMMPAQYFCSGELPTDQWHHYGLAAPVYTHFTSPIRRYADVLVHRLLSASIGVIPLPAANADRSKQQELCSHMNRRHRAAQYAQRASVSLHTLIYFRENPSTEAAYALSITEEKLTVLVPRFGIEGALRWDRVAAALGADGQVFDPVAHVMTLTRSGGAGADGGQEPAKKKQKKQKGTSSNTTSNTSNTSFTTSEVLKVRVFDQVQVGIRVRGGEGGAERRLVLGLVVGGVDLELLLEEKPQLVQKDGAVAMEL